MYPSDRRLLLTIAREAIAAHVARAAAPSLHLTGAAGRPGGAFVTIRKHGELRGCIGHIAADDAVGAIVARCAVAACSADPRFAPVSARELNEIVLELSLLGPLVPIARVDQIEVGRHGVMIERDRHRGLLLPQVASERGWDRDTFVAQTCRKAGLPKDAWKHGSMLWTFEAEVFSEAENPLHHGGH